MDFLCLPDPPVSKDVIFRLCVLLQFRMASSSSRSMILISSELVFQANERVCRRDCSSGHSPPYRLIQTFRIHQKRTAKVSNSRTSTNHLGPLTRYRVIYRFRRRPNHHNTTYPFRELSIPFERRGTGEGLVPNFKKCFP